MRLVRTNVRTLAPLNRLGVMIDRASGIYCRLFLTARNEGKRGNVKAALHATVRADRTLARAMRLQAARKALQGLGATVRYVDVARRQVTG